MSDKTAWQKYVTWGLVGLWCMIPWSISGCGGGSESPEQKAKAEQEMQQLEQQLSTELPAKLD